MSSTAPTVSPDPASASQASADTPTRQLKPFAAGDRVRWYNPPLCMGTVLKHSGSRCKVQWDTGEMRRDEPGKLRLVRPADEPARNVTGLINLIETRIIGVRPEDQDVELEDTDWRAVVAALERDQVRRSIAAARATIAQKAVSGDHEAERRCKDAFAASATWEDFVERLVAILVPAPAAVGVAVPASYALVPVEPTQAMLDAAEDAYVSGYTGTPTASPEEVWSAMIAAAPTPRAAPERSNDDRCPDCGGPLDANGECPGWSERTEDEVRAEATGDAEYYKPLESTPLRSATPPQGAKLDLAGVEAAVRYRQAVQAFMDWIPSRVTAEPFHAEESAYREGVDDAGATLDAAISSLQRDAAIASRTAAAETGGGVTEELRWLSEAATPDQVESSCQHLDTIITDAVPFEVAYFREVHLGGSSGERIISRDQAKANCAFAAAAWNDVRARIAAEDRASLARGTSGREG